MEERKLNVLAYAKVQMTIMMIIGLVLGLVYSIGGFFVDVTGEGLNPGTAMAFLAIIGVPMIAAVFGLVTGVVGAYIYNITLSKHGGVDIDIKQ